jgi:hypothetical protein
VTVYARSGTTLTKLANPSALPAGTGRGVAWGADNGYIALGHDASPYITVYVSSTPVAIGIVKVSPLT